MSYRVVPLEPTEEMTECGKSNWSRFCRDGSDLNEAARRLYCAMLAAAPPLPPDVEEVVEIAEFYCRPIGTTEGRDILQDVFRLARALLKVTGREE